MKRSDPTVEALGALPALADCARSELSWMARHLDEVRLAPGQVLTVEGRAGREGFLLVEGSAVVYRDGAVAAELGPGHLVGLVALLDAQVHTAQVVASSPLTTLVFDRRGLEALLSVPAVARTARAQLARRIRLADARADRQAPPLPGDATPSDLRREHADAMAR